MTIASTTPDTTDMTPSNLGPLRSKASYWLIAPGVIWMTLFLVVPLGMMVYVSFWSQTTFKIEPILTTKSWETFFSSDTYLNALWTTIRIWLLVLLSTFVVGYPTALFVGLFVKNKTLATTLLVLCVIPFWTSFLIRVLAWRPMLGKEGAINIILQALHITREPIEALLFTELSVIIGMTQIYCVFMVGPIAFMLGRIDPNVIEAARDLGASFWRIFRTIILPLSMPGVLVGLGLALVANSVGIDRTWWSTAFVLHVVYTFPFAFLVMLAIFNRFDPSVEEAAWSLGVSPIKTFRKVTFPLIFPGVLSAMLFAFTLSYDEFSRTLFASGRDLTLPLAIYGTFSIEIHPNIFAFGVLTTLFSFALLAVYAILMTVSLRRAKRLAIQEDA